MEKRYFHTFDALRFFAFLKVFLLHIPITAFPVYSFVKAGGGIGVQFFFVLSGFLITYLIYEEKAQNRFTLPKFFMRRILRIWPLYYLMVGVSFATPFLLDALGVAYSNDGYRPKWIYSLTFLENYRMIALNDHPNVSPLTVMWSLCIEEHFYIIWGITAFFLPLKRLPWLILTALTIALGSRIVFVHQGWSTSDLLTNFDLFALGAVPAWLLVKNGEVFERRVDRIPLALKLGFVLLVVASLFMAPRITGKSWEVLQPLVSGIFFTGLVILFIPRNGRFRIPDNNVFTRWGKYTYGLYLYHTILINLLLKVWQELAWPLDRPLQALFFFALAFSANLLVSKYSYYWFEKPFLGLKKWFY